ncbi:hypothetical protein [Bacillus toyonensis]|uniref:hypothetical protein n=1 Tax=Bacillus toyonensis TaxID=155322 RepID=UPI002E1E7E5C|nr:hypothetical protein [Bacillus toyonensis]
MKDVVVITIFRNAKRKGRDMRKNAKVLGLSVFCIVAVLLMLKVGVWGVNKPEIKKDSAFVYNEKGAGILKNELNITFKDGVSVQKQEELAKEYGLEKLLNSGEVINNYKVLGDKVLSFEELLNLIFKIAEEEKEIVNSVTANEQAFTDSETSKRTLIQ